MTIKIYQGQNRVNGNIYPQFTLTYYDGTQRKKKRFADLAKARREAEFTAEKLSKGEHQVLNLTSIDRTIYIQAVETLRPLNVPLNVAVQEYASAVKQLGSSTFVMGKRMGMVFSGGDYDTGKDVSTSMGAG